MSVIGSNIIAGASGTVETGYQISRSLRFNSADSAYLNRTPASAGNLKTWTWSGWVKRAALGTAQRIFQCYSGGGATQDRLLLSASDTLGFYSSVNTDTTRIVSTQVFRDLSAWFHVVLSVDTTQATASNRMRMYVNGSQVTAFGTASYPSQNQDLNINSAIGHNISGYGAGAGELLSAYLADVRFIDGQALDPTSFGEFDANTGVWVPKAYTGTYGTNGFWLKFDDNSGTTSTTLGKDSSGNGNNWTPNNFSVTAGVGNDSLVDSPTNYGTDTGAGGEVRGNYAVLNAALNQTQYALSTPASTGGTLSNGALQALGQASNWNGWIATIGVSSGKWYWEITEDLEPNSFSTIIGITNPAKTTTYTVSASSFAAGDTMGFALDLDAGTFVWYKNGTLQATLATGLTGEWFPVVSLANGNQVTCNFGQRAFAYTAPSGFKALCTANLPTPAIGASSTTLASQQMNIALWTGNGSTNAITGVGFAPDLAWVKARSNAYSHNLSDRIRGNSSYLVTNTTAAEDTTYPNICVFGSDGVTLSSASSANVNGTTNVGWFWKANGAGVSNTAGSITSTVSANTTAGISVVTYTGNSSVATVGHGLGAVPKMIIVKNRNSAVNWIVYHSSIGAANTLVLNTTAASSADAAWGSTTPTSTVFTVGNTGSGNQSGSSHVAYCFAEVAGFSKFGSFTGNGSADGAFVYCGFRPRWVLVKSTGVENWIIHDTARDGFNVTNKELIPNSAGAEGTTTPFDILSNGFKMRAVNNALNASGQTYIFAAFAEAAFNFSRAR